MECLYVLVNPWDPLVGVDVPVAQALVRRRGLGGVFWARGREHDIEGAAMQRIVTSFGGLVVSLGLFVLSGACVAASTYLLSCRMLQSPARCQVAHCRSCTTCWSQRHLLRD